MARIQDVVGIMAMRPVGMVRRMSRVLLLLQYHRLIFHSLALALGLLFCYFSLLCSKCAVSKRTWAQNWMEQEHVVMSKPYVLLTVFKCLMSREVETVIESSSVRYMWSNGGHLKLN